MLITSKANSTVLAFSRLSSKKERDLTGKYLIEGYRSVKDSLPYLSDPQLLLSESAYNKYGDEFSPYRLTVCADHVLDSITDTQSSQGVLCMADIPGTKPLFEEKRAIFLDRIRDPGNMGTIIRTALATGFNDIYCFDCVDAYNPKVVRSTMSAISRVNIYEAGVEVLNELKQNGYKIIAADMSGKNVFEVKSIPEKVCLIVGNEANGISDDVSTMSDIVFSLPMIAGESLNAGVSAAVLMYQLTFGGKS